MLICWRFNNENNMLIIQMITANWIDQFKKWFDWILSKYCKPESKNSKSSIDPSPNSCPYWWGTILPQYPHIHICTYPSFAVSILTCRGPDRINLQRAQSRTCEHTQCWLPPSQTSDLYLHPQEDLAAVEEVLALNFKKKISKYLISTAYGKNC